MAIFQPSQITPSVLSGIGNGTVDISNNEITVSWHINGQSGMIGYALEVYDTSAFTYLAKYPALYDKDNPTSAYQSVSPSAYGYASDGSPLVFSTGNITLEQIPQAPSLANGNAYQLKIVQFWQDSQGNIQYIKQNSNSVFYAREAPAVSIDAIGTGGVVDSRSYTFNGTYSQADGDALDWFEWTIFSQNDPSTPIFYSGKITGAGDISCIYDGFFNGESYTIVLTVQTQNGVIATTSEDFSVEYTPSSTTVWAGASCVQGTDAVLVQWNTPSRIDGTATGNYTIENSTATLQTGASIKWPSAGAFSFAAPWCVVYVVTVQDENATLLSIENENGDFLNVRRTAFSAIWGLTIEASAGGVGFGTIVSGIPANTLLTITITPTSYQVQISGGTTKTGSLPLPQFSFSSITLNGSQICSSLQVIQGSSASGTTKYFSVDWSNGIVAISEIPSGDVGGFDIYRVQANSTVLTKVASLDATGENKLYDYGALSQQGAYAYHIFPLSEDDAYAAIATNSISPCWWNYTLMECQATDDKKIFTVLRAFRFRNNIETAAIANNNNPGILQNFTPYPTIQLSPSNYKSSVLASLIGVVAYDGDGQPQYLDSLQTRDAIYALSVSSNPLFLKTRKGDLIRVKISASISMQIADGTVEQMQTMTLPWVEVGSAEGVSLYSTTYVGVQEQEGSSTTPGSNVNIESLMLNQNGTYVAPEGTAYTPVYAQIPVYDGSVETV